MKNVTYNQNEMLRQASRDKKYRWINPNDRTNTMNNIEFKKLLISNTSDAIA